MASEKKPTSGGDEATGDLDAGNVPSTSQSVLQYFWDLASYDEDVRLSAARGLVADVAGDQSKHQAALGKDTEAAPEDGAPKIKQLEYHLRRCSPTMVYTLRRLARGLGSSRQAARQGYASALAGLLGASRCITPAGVLVLLEVCNDGPLKGGDAKDTLLGRIFGFGALLRSELPLQPDTLLVVFNGLLDAGQRKSFLRECAAAAALEAAARMDAAEVAAAAAPGQPLAKLLAADPAEATPEALLLALVLWPKLPTSVLSTCKLLPAGTPPPPPELYAAAGSQPCPLPAAAAAAVATTATGLFSRQHLVTLQPVLLATSASHPRMHTLWQYLLPLLLPGFKPNRNTDLEGGPAPEAAPPQAAAAAAAATPGGKAAAKAAKAAAAAAKSAEGKGAVSGPLLEAFWGVVVEGGLMDSSHERRYLGFQLFSRVLPHLRPEHVPVVFSPAFTKTFTTSVRKNNSYLHASARRLLDGISAFLERGGGGGESGGEGADSGVKMAVVAALQRLGGMAPRELLAGKLTQKLVQGVDAERLHRTLEALTGAFLKGAQPGAQPSAANGHAGAGPDAGGKEEEGGEDEEERQQLVSERRRQCLEQLLAALKFPGVTELDSQAALRFLALHAFAQVQGTKAAKSKVTEVQQAATQLTTPVAPATRATAAARLVTLLSYLSQQVQLKMRAAQKLQDKAQAQQRKAQDGGGQAQDGAAAAAASQPAAKKRKTAGGAEAAATAAADAPAAPPPSAVYQPLHDTLSYIRKALKAPGVSPAAELGEDGDNALQLLAAIEAACLERLAALDAAKGSAAAGAAAATEAPGHKDPGQGPVASRLRSLAALAAHLQLHLLSDPEGFEKDLPLSLRRVAAEGLGLEGLPEVEVEQEEEEEEGEGKKKRGGSDASDAGAAAWSDVLVDVLLALMARPGGSVPIAPLREVGEALWRQCCEMAGAEGLADIVRVVAAGGKGEGQDEAGLFESDDEEEEDDDEEEDDEEESGSESEEEEEEEEAAGKKGKKGGAGRRKRRKADEDGSEDEEEAEDDEEEEGPGAGKKAGGKKAGGGDDGDDSGSGSEGGDGDDDDDMDDEAMFRLDDKLAAYFRTMVGGRAGSAAATERAEALVNFRLRALALLEAFAKKVPHSPLLLTTLVPLLRALATASRPGGKPQVAARLRSVMLGKLCKCRCKLDAAVMGGVEGYSTALKRLLYEASRNRNKEVAEVAVAAYTALLRAGAGTEDSEVAEAARSSFRAAATDMLTKKKTRLQPEGLLAAMRAAPAACLPSLDLVLHHVTAGRNAHVRLAAAELAAQLFRAPPAGLAAALTGGGGGSSALGGALGAAMAACVAGVGMKAKQHKRLAQAAEAMADGLKKLLGGKRPAEVLGADKVNAIAKAVVTVQNLPSLPAKVSKSVGRLVDKMALGPLLQKTNPDPALTARILKAQPGKDAGAHKGKDKNKDDHGKGKGKEAAAKGKAGTEKQQQAQQEQKKKKTQQQQKAEGKKRKPEEEDDEEGDEEEDEAAQQASDSGADDDDDSGSGDGTDGEEGGSGNGSSSEESSGSGGSDDDEDDEEEEEEREAGEKRVQARGGKGPGKGRGKGKGAAMSGGAKPKVAPRPKVSSAKKARR